MGTNMDQCFVIMPIASGDAYQVYKNRYEHIIKPAVEQFHPDGEQVFVPVRADFMSHTGSVNRSVIQTLYNARLVIADLTDLNPNVFYELGVRHSLRNGTILTALKGTKPPFDVGDISIVFFEDRVGAEREAIPLIQEKMRGLYHSSTVKDSPVFDAIPDLNRVDVRELSELRGRMHSAEAEASDTKLKLSVAEAVNKQLRQSLTLFEDTVSRVLASLAPSEQQRASSALHQAATHGHSNVVQLAVKSKLQTQEGLAFVLMPFNSDFSKVYDAVRAGLSAAGLAAWRADDISASGLISDQILESIAKSEIIVADITNSNPNVLYEIGIATSLQKKIILVSQSTSNIPFDLAAQRVFRYEFSDIGLLELSKVLTRAALSFRK